MIATPVPPGVPATAGSGGLRLQVFGLCLDRGGRRLLDGIDLQLNPNELVGILAPSGAGKTSLLERLAGFSVPPADHGRIVFDNRPLTEDSLAAYRATVGYVAQDDLLYRNLTGRENLAYAARLRWPGRTRRAETAAAIAATLERLGLQAEEADRPPARLSGGQRRRLNLALELLARPRLLLLDEPTAGLDPASESHLMRLLQCVAHSGTTVLCATHVLDNLHRFDRVIVLADHRVDFAGSPRHLLDHYRATSFTQLYEHLDHRAGHAAAPAVGPEASPEFDLPPSEPIAPTAPDEAAAASTITAGADDTGCSLPVAEPGDGGDPDTCLGWVGQVRALTWRSFRSLRRDGGWLLLLTLSPLIVGSLINLSQVQAGSACLPITFAVVAAIWLGLTNSVREVVRDRKHYTRERLLGVGPTGYLAAKVLTFGLIGLAQVMALWLVVRYGHEPAGTPSRAAQQLAWWPWWQAMAVLWWTYLAALGLGLIVSTLAGSEEGAVAMLPLLILPQLLLTGAATQQGAGTELSGNGWFCPLAETWAALHPAPASPAPDSGSPDDDGFVVLSGPDGDTVPAVPSADTPAPAGPPANDWRWIVEGASALTYSRPALDLLHLHWYRKTSAERLPALLDVAHLALAVAATALAAWLIFRWRERRWLDRA